MMKFIISLTVIYALILEITGYPAVLVPGYPCPSEDINGGCRGPKECLYPHPTNCSRFIQCTAGPSPPGGLAYDMPCALMQDGNRLQWNDNKKECDWPSSSTCKPTTPTRTTTTPSTTTTTTTTTTTPSTTTTTPTTTTTTPSTTTTTPTTTTPTTTTPGPTVSPCFFCSIADIITTSCRGSKDCLYPNPDDCNSFIQCSVNPDNKTGTPVVMRCPAGLEWNDVAKKCDWAPSPTCPNSPITTTTTSTTTTTPSTTTTTTTTPSTTTTTPSTRASLISTSFKCPVDDITKTGCKGPTDCMYRDPNSCYNFIHCSVNADNKTGTPHIKACAPSSPRLEWNDLDKKCDFPPSPTCKTKLY